MWIYLRFNKCEIIKSIHSGETISGGAEKWQESKDIVSFMPMRPTQGQKSVVKWNNTFLKRITVASPGIEPGSGASETLILSVVQRGLFYQSGYITAEDFYDNGQQYYAKKFTYGDHSAGTEHSFNQIEGFQNDIYDDQVEQDGNQ